jgi:hypothetical protein
MALRIFEIVSLILVFGILLSQFFVPFYKGLPVFPIFRKSNKLEKELVDLHEEQVVRDLESTLKQERSKLDELNVKQ